MPRIDKIRLRCIDPTGQRRFYQDVLGMGSRGNGVVAYGPREAGLQFEPASEPYRPSGTDLYWKVAIAVPNIELAHDQLTARGVEVGVPHQFQDIGYLAHFQDPEGFTVELIEHWFHGNRPCGQHDRTLLGGGAALNLLTLRCHDIAPLRSECLSWGMVPLSIQAVLNHGFTLHFFAFTDEAPPNPDLTAVDNREWLYQRPYTVLEIQEVHGADPMTRSNTTEAGYIGSELVGMLHSMDSRALAIVGRPSGI